MCLGFRVDALMPLGLSGFPHEEKSTSPSRSANINVEPRGSKIVVGLLMTVVAFASCTPGQYFLHIASCQILGSSTSQDHAALCAVYPGFVVALLVRLYYTCNIGYHPLT